MDGIEALSKNYKEWSKDYEYHLSTNEFEHKDSDPIETELVKEWFNGSMI